MGNIAGLDDLVLRLTGGGSNSAPENIFFFIDNRVANANAVVSAGRMYSLWTYNRIPGEGAAPGAVAAPTNATAGSLFQTDPAGGTQKWLLGMNVMVTPNTYGTLILYDRLLHISGLSGTNTGAQTVGGSVTRYTNGVGNQIWWEIYTAIGTTARTITASYTNQSGTSGRTSQQVEIGSSNFDLVQEVHPFTLASGDTGVQAVASVTLSASTLTAGNFGITIAHPLASIPINATALVSERQFFTCPCPVEIKAGACLAFAWISGTATAPSFIGNLITVCA